VGLRGRRPGSENKVMHAAIGPGNAFFEKHFLLAVHVGDAPMYLLPRLSIVAFMLAVSGAAAQQAAVPPPGMPRPEDTWTLPNRDAMNANTVTIITAPAGGATAIFGSDMARVLDDGNLRVLPVLGKGPVRNVVDILYLKAIDMGMVAGDVPE